MTSPYELPSSLQTHVEGNRHLNINLHRTLLKAVNLPVKYFVSHILIPYPNWEVFRKHIKKKDLNIHCLRRFFGCSQLMDFIHILRAQLFKARANPRLA